MQEVLDIALEQLQGLHPSVNVKSKFTGNYFIQPWLQLSRLPSGYHQIEKVQKYCNISPQGKNPTSTEVQRKKPIIVVVADVLLMMVFVFVAVVFVVILSLLQMESK